MAWVHSEAPSRLVGGAMAWAASRGAGELHLVVDDAEAAGTVARRAAGFSRPPTVWIVEDRNLVPAVAAPLPEPAPPPPAALALVPVIESAGAEAVAEHGTVKAEVKGLEVARVETDDGVRLAVGVGRHDREARRIVHAGEPADPAAELAGAVRTVSAHRRAGAASHPANQLAGERWLRWVLVRHPELVGARSLAPFPPPGPAPDLVARVPAPALGSAPDGQTLVVVASVGVDLELAPAAVDAFIAAGDPSALLVVVVPEGDDLPATRRLVGALAAPAEVRTVPRDWRARS
ncbi:MAG TPA: hypothetical protein VFP54_06940 [Acidimicrobiales bacterium]|nr:hypothetical protein [Acidimicrobiales bacterium]